MGTAARPEREGQGLRRAYVSKTCSKYNNDHQHKDIYEKDHRQCATNNIRGIVQKFYLPILRSLTSLISGDIT